MSWALIWACIWVLAAAVTALLPMKRQMLPGVTLLVLAPVLIVWIGWQHGWAWAAFGVFAFVSMFRNPLIYFAKKAMGKPVELPKELQE
jgi:Protein of unknown function (DUF2484)